MTTNDHHKKSDLLLLKSHVLFYRQGYINLTVIISFILILVLLIVELLFIDFSTYFS